MLEKAKESRREKLKTEGKKYLNCWHTPHDLKK